ncbi:hypothetical protein MOVS_10785 (plasmid) [Moraxella ovis]|uniref:Uncharacterized protein n=1 Tax=Moraxella ovis TaxID=29433 RepID=A0A378QGY8_9GAMM|nr:hypothetical protein [Moraxella ovis]ANB92572.1 hypothetical protein MOVS_10785 [Moraxella ovis]STY98583.1 Uncharacterised protein [Moraxella ovis]
MKALLLLILIFGATQSYAQQMQREYTVTRTMNLGYKHNQDAFINHFREQAPLEYERAWKYISYELNLEDGLELDDLRGHDNRTARIIPIRWAFDYFITKGN